MTFFLGLDIGKDTFHAVLLDERGAVLKSKSFANTAKGFVQLLAWLPDPSQTLAVCEPTGVYGKRLQYALASALGGLHEINAAVLRKFSFSQVQTKTDEADALSIAQAARTLFLSRPEILERSRVVCDLARENLALWLNEYARLLSASVALQNQIAALDHHVAPDVDVIRQRRRRELARLLRERKLVGQRIEALFRQFDDRQAQLIDSIPGIGTLTTATTLVVVRDIRRFKSADALKAYLGVYPVRRQSSTREWKSHLAHHGHRMMRHMLWNAAKAAVWNKHPQNPFKQLFDRLRAKGKSYNAAIGAVCRKLVQTIYGVLRSQTPFQYPQTT